MEAVCQWICIPSRGGCLQGQGQGHCNVTVQYTACNCMFAMLIPFSRYSKLSVKIHKFFLPHVHLALTFELVQFEFQKLRVHVLLHGVVCVIIC